MGGVATDCRGRGIMGLSAPQSPAAGARCGQRSELDCPPLDWTFRCGPRGADRGLAGILPLSTTLLVLAGSQQQHLRAMDPAK
jgi:hypothetical protein